MELNTCPKCQSNKIIPDTRIVDYAHANAKRNLSIQIKTSDKLLFNTFEKGDLTANICGSCGYVELSVNNPHRLWEAYLKHKTL
jgi:hypothetical protein